MAADAAVVTRLAPVNDEAAVRIAIVSLHMLLPIGIVVPDAVGPREIPCFHRREELVYAMLRRQIPKQENRQQGGRNDHDSAQTAPMVRLRSIVGRSIQQCHVL
jgi:hypothetical protein